MLFQRDIIELNDVEKCVGSHSKDILYGLVDSLVKKHATNFSFVHDIDESPVWISNEIKENYVCSECEKFHKQGLIKYGPKYYCKNCLKEIHDAEDIAESEGKPTKRFISAPPSDVIIK